MDPARGHARVGEIWYCHGGGSDGPTCYTLASWERSREGASSSPADELFTGLEDLIEVLEGRRED